MRRGAAHVEAAAFVSRRVGGDVGTGEVEARVALGVDASAVVVGPVAHDRAAVRLQGAQRVDAAAVRVGGVADDGDALELE